MLIIKTSNHNLHNPAFELFEGELVPHAEKASRVESILEALYKTAWQIQEVRERVPLKLLKQVHQPEYVKFLKDFCLNISDEKSHFPSVFPKNISRKLSNRQALLGYYSFDSYTPLLKNTFEVALASVSTSYEAAKLIQSGEKVVYSLCRPPGHHADSDQMGGYCYLNNSAVAAHYLSQFGKVSILDLDFHHGNGTQGIFYKRSDVFYISLHADPNWKFPHFSGFANETGEQEGEGYTLNIPLGKGTDNKRYTVALKKAIKKIKQFDGQFLIISLGLDTHQADPISGFQLTTDYFSTMGKMISGLNLPTVIVQEGGYNTDILGTSVVNFLRSFDKY